MVPREEGRVPSWTLIEARLNPENGAWVARAKHADGRTLVCEVPGPAGPLAAEAGLVSIIAAPKSFMGILTPEASERGAA